MSELYHSGLRRRDGRPWRPALANHGHTLSSRNGWQSCTCVRCWRTYARWQVTEGYLLPICTGGVRALPGEVTR